MRARSIPAVQCVQVACSRSAVLHTDSGVGTDHRERRRFILAGGKGSFHEAGDVTAMCSGAECKHVWRTSARPVRQVCAGPLSRVHGQLSLVLVSRALWWSGQTLSIRVRLSQSVLCVRSPGLPSPLTPARCVPFVFFTLLVCGSMAELTLQMPLKEFLVAATDCCDK